MSKYDTGIPQDYYCCVVIESHSGAEPMVYFCSKLHWKKFGYIYDQHLVKLDEWFDANCMNLFFCLMEGVYETDFSVLNLEDGNVQAVYSWLLKHGFEYDPLCLDMREVIVPNEIPETSVEAKTQTVSTPVLSTDALKNHLVFILPTLKKMQEMFYAYEEHEPEFKSMRNPKKWKRTKKVKGRVADILDEDESIIVLQQNKFGSMDMIVMRTFIWADNPDEDTYINYYTTENDTEIVAVGWHID